MNWYVCYIKEKSEKKVASQLSKRKISFFSPESYLNNRSKNIHSNLLRSCMFVYLDEKNIETITSITGISNIVYWLNKPVVVQDAEIKILKYIFDVSNSLFFEKIDINTTEPICINNLDSTDTKIGLSSKSKVRVTFPTLGYCIIGNIPMGKTKQIVTESIAV